MLPQVEGTNHFSFNTAEASRSAPTCRCFPSEDWRVIWAPTFAPKVGAFQFLQGCTPWALALATIFNKGRAEASTQRAHRSANLSRKLRRCRGYHLRFVLRAAFFLQRLAPTITSPGLILRAL
jgi:hypothetical protein